MSLHYYIDACHLVPDVMERFRLLCEGHFLGRLVSSSSALLRAHCIFSGKSLPYWHSCLCPVNTIEQAGEIRLSFSTSGGLDSLGIMLETTEPAIKTRFSHPHGMN